jgi:hypothetical protein
MQKVARFAVHGVLAGAIVLLMAARPATAALTTWVFQGATFDDGGTLSGSFQFDGVSTYSNINIVTTAGTHTNGAGGPLAAYTFTNAGTYVGGNSQTSLEICTMSCNSPSSLGNESLVLYFGTSTTGAGLTGPSPVVIFPRYIDDFQWQGTGSGIISRTITSGQVVAAPEPKTAVLLLLGIGAFLIGVRSKSLGTGILKT